MTRETYARPIGYGAMCLESLVAIMALIAACTLDPGVYLSMNVKGEAAATVAKVSALGFPVTVEQMNQMAGQIGEKSLFGRTGGAATLAVGMAHIFSRAVNGRWLDLWYHFAIMFDAGTRVGRYLLQDALGHFWKPLGDTKRLSANVLASVLMVAGWGYFLIQGVRDPLGGINSLWPLFGIANQMLAAIALCLVTTVILKMAMQRQEEGAIGSKSGRPALALITFLPLVWLLAVTMTAGVQKIFHSDPRIGFLSQASDLAAKAALLEKAVGASKLTGDAALIRESEKALRTNGILRFNNLLDAVVAGIFLLLLSSIVLLSAHEWVLMLARRKLAVLRESDPVWLPDYAIAEAKPMPMLGLIGLAFALAKELSGEAQMERAQKAENMIASPEKEPTDRQASQRHYIAFTKERFNGIRRCC